jgi:hypothetical protein
MKVVELKRKQYQDYQLVFEYETDEHYAVKASDANGELRLELRREKLGKTIKKSFAENIFQRY